MGHYNHTNKHGISLAMAVFLLYDDYDYDDRPNAISATTLMRPLRQLVLSQQNKELLKTVDISDLVASCMGSAIHDRCERAWKSRENVSRALKLFGASDSAIETVVINPTKPLLEGQIPVYVEQRTETVIDGFIITGKYDIVLDGIVNDYKSGSVWGYIYDSNSKDYTEQGSIYKWLNPEKITGDYINIQSIFTDWSKSAARQDPKRYPQLRVLTKAYPVWGTEETEHWIKCKLEAYKQLATAPQEMLPECTDEELWASEPVYKYYKNPQKTVKSTKNFPTMDEAVARKHEDGDVGIVKTRPGEVKRCSYCPVEAICDQARKLEREGRLNL